MLLPVKRNQLTSRNALDFEDELAAAATRSPEQGLLETIELSEVVRQLNEANAASFISASTAAETAEMSSSGDDLEIKARLYVRPLSAAAK